MSRPHDSQRTFLPFSNPFRLILPKRSHYLSPKLFAILSSFEQTLAENLKKLKPENTSDVLTLSWLRQAMELLSKTHSNVKTLVTDLQFPISDWDEKWVDIYLDNSVKLLDICIALSSELSRLDQGHLLLQYVLHILDSSNIPSSEHLKRSHASLHDWTKQVNLRSSRLENSVLILPRLATSLYVAKAKNSAKGKVLMRVLYGVKVVTVFVCGVLVAALLGSAKPLMELRVPNKFLWAEAFNDLQGDVNGAIRSLFSCGKVMVHELEVVEACVEKLHGPTCAKDEHCEELKGDVLELAGRAKECVERLHSPTCDAKDEKCEELKGDVLELAERAKELANELDLFSKQVEDFFQIVLTGRDALLCNLREPDVVQEIHVDENKIHVDENKIHVDENKR